MKITIGHSTKALSITTNWIYSQLTMMEKYDYVAVVEKIQKDCLHLGRLYCINNLNIWKKFIFKILRRFGITDYKEYIFRRNHIALLHSHFGYVGFADLSIAGRLGVPHITTFYGCDISQPQREPIWLEKYSELFEKCNIFLTEGNYMKKCLVDMGCSEKKVIVQHLGVNLEKIQYIPRKIGHDGKIKIMATGTFTEKKGLTYALEAFAYVREKHRDIELMLIGGVPDESNMEFLKTRKEIFDVIKERKLNNCVRLLGYLPYDEYIRISQEAHIFISPSVTAKNGDTEGGAPVAIIEMSASGMPILSTFHCDIPEVVIDGQTGHLVPERDSEALASKLDYLISHPDIWQEIGLKGRQHIEREYNLTKQVEKLEDIYDMLIQKD